MTGPVFSFEPVDALLAQWFPDRVDDSGRVSQRWVSRRLRLDPPIVREARISGMDWKLADRVASALDRWPCDLWPDWEETTLKLAEEAEAPAGDELFPERFDDWFARWIGETG